MAKVVCKAGNKSGLKCDHKRNQGEFCLCAIDATPQQCSFAKPAKEYSDEIKAKLEV